MTERQATKEWGRTVLRLRKEGTFAELLRAEINASEYSAKEVSDRIGVSLGSVNKWKAGDSYPLTHFVYRLSILLHGDDWVEALVRYNQMIDKERMIE